MILYLDASALAKRYLREDGTQWVNHCLQHSPCVTSRWSEVELASALARRCRQGAFPPSERDRALAALRADLLSEHVVELTPAVTRLATELLARHPLRAGDAAQLAAALHLKSLVGRPVELLAFDDRLSRAAADEGLVLARETEGNPGGG